MDTAPRHLRVFLSSPGDVATERAMALRLLQRLQYDPSMRGRVNVETVAWDNPDAPTPMPATLTPQEAVNQASPKPSECDIVVVILWTRIGTPLPREVTKADGSCYLSGTEWEYEDALQSDRRPTILVYRRTDAAPIDPGDPDRQKKEEQVRGVSRFFERFDNPDGSIRRAYERYQGPEQFKEKLEYQLRDIIWRLLDGGSDNRSAGPKVRQKLQSHISVGERLAAQHRYAEAIAEYEKALQIDEDDREAHSRLIAGRRGQLLLQAFGPQSSMSVALRHDHARSQLAPQTQIDAALTAVYRLQALHPAAKEDVAVLLDEALIHKVDHNLAEAVRLLREAHALAPENGEVLAELGLLLAFSSEESSSDWSDGIACIRRAIEIGPNEARFHFYLAHALSETCLCPYAGLESRGDDDAHHCAEAVREYHRAADLAAPKDIWQISRRARESAMDIFHRYARKEGDILTPSLSMPLEERAKELEYLIPVTPGNMSGLHDDPRFWLASLHRATGSLEEADREIRELLQKDHDDWLGQDRKYWEDEEFIEHRELWFELFVGILEERGSDPEVLAAIKARIQKGS